MQVVDGSGQQGNGWKALWSRAVPVSVLAQETWKLRFKCADASGLTVALGKTGFLCATRSRPAESLRYAKEVMTMSSLAPDAQEVISAFLEKRTPCCTDH